MFVPKVSGIGLETDGNLRYDLVHGPGPWERRRLAGRWFPITMICWILHLRGCQRRADRLCEQDAKNGSAASNSQSNCPSLAAMATQNHPNRRFFPALPWDRAGLETNHPSFHLFRPGRDDPIG